jgi:thiol-disulfide isomerase/thioredoxin
MVHAPSHGSVPGQPVLLGVVLIAMGIAAGSGCSDITPPHPAVGRTVGGLPLVSLADSGRPAPTFTGKVTLLNFWGTWCPPCRRELPGLVRLASRLADQPAFQLVAISCGGRLPENMPMLAESTAQLLAEERLSLEAWADPDGRARQIAAAMLGFSAFPTTYLVGPDATVRQVWVGYRSRDEADMARALVALLKQEGLLLPDGAPRQTIKEQRNPGPPAAR